MGRCVLRLTALSLAVGLLLVLGGCGGSDADTPPTERAPAPDGPPIRLGTKNFTEQTILGELYRQALEAKGYDVVLKPDIGDVTVLRFTGHRHTASAMLTGLAVGFYDGALGPGTGSFFVFILVGLLGYDFLEASAKARLANWATNLAALCVFVPQGQVLWEIGLLMGAANLVGGYLGARTAVARGARFVRAFFMVVVSAFVVRIGGEVLGLWS